MKVKEILYEMTLQDAILIFNRLGYDVATMTPEDIKTARRTLILKYHPDRTGNTDLAANINAAYDLLKNYNPRQAQNSTPTTPTTSDPRPGAPIYRPPPRDPNITRERDDFRRSWYSKR